MLPRALLQPLFPLVTVVLPAVQSLHALHGDSAVAVEEKNMWLSYWLLFVLGRWLTPYLEWIVCLPLYILSAYVDIYYEGQLVALLLLLLPRPLLFKRLFREAKARLRSDDTLPVAMWNIVLIGVTLPSGLVAVLGLLTVKHVVPPQQRLAARDALARAVIVLTCLAWRLAVSLCFWVRVECDGLDEFRRDLGSSGRPCVILPNHVSFVDIIMAVILMPVSKVGKVRMMVSDHVFKMPLIGVIAEAMGHLPVPFTSQDSDSFAVDKDVMAKKMVEMEVHVANGGYGGWFPEGRLNPGDTHKVGVFRAGGFSVALKTDVELWCMASVGNSVFWPRKAPVGGRPCRIGVRIFRLCESTAAYCADVQATDGKAVDRARAEHLANSAQDAMQKAVDELVRRGFVGNPSPAKVVKD